MDGAATDRGCLLDCAHSERLVALGSRRGQIVVESRVAQDAGALHQREAEGLGQGVEFGFWKLVDQGCSGGVDLAGESVAAGAAMEEVTPRRAWPGDEVARVLDGEADQLPHMSIESDGIGAIDIAAEQAIPDMSPPQIGERGIAPGALFDDRGEQVQRVTATVHVLGGRGQPVAIEIGIEDAGVHGWSC